MCNTKICTQCSVLLTQGPTTGFEVTVRKWLSTICSQVVPGQPTTLLLATAVAQKGVQLRFVIRTEQNVSNKQMHYIFQFLSVFRFHNNSHINLISAWSICHTLSSVWKMSSIYRQHRLHIRAQLSVESIIL